MELKEMIEIIKASVRPDDAARSMGIVTGRDKRTKCVFCSTTTRPSLKIDERMYYCFACHAHGDVFGLVQNYLGLDSRSTIRWFNDEYGLGLDPDAKPDRKKQAEIKRKREAIRAKRERLQKAQNLAFERVCNLGVWIGQLEDWKRSYAPKNGFDDCDIRFVNAMHWLELFREEAERMSVYATGDYWKTRFEALDRAERELVARKGGKTVGTNGRSNGDTVHQRAV